MKFTPTNGMKSSELWVSIATTIIGGIVVGYGWLTEEEFLKITTPIFAWLGTVAARKFGKEKT